MTKTLNTNPYEVSTADYLEERPNPILMFGFAIIMFFGFFLPLLWCGYQDTHYETTAKVYSVDTSETIFIDGAGYLWAVTDTDYKVGEFVELKFENNRTDYTRNDDKIVNVIRLDN